MSGMVGQNQHAVLADEGRRTARGSRFGSPALRPPAASVTSRENSNRSATPGPERGLQTLDHRPVGLPGLVALDVAHGPVERRESFGRHIHRPRACPENLLDPAKSRREAPRARPCRAARRHPARAAAGAAPAAARRSAPSSTSPTPHEGFAVAREVAAGVEGGREVVAVFEADPAMGRADAEQAAMARRRPHRPGRIGAEREIAEAVRHRRGRTGRRAARGCGRARRHSPACRNGRSCRDIEKASSSVMVLPTKRAPASSKLLHDGRRARS